MKSSNWKAGFFWLTLVLSILFGFWGAIKTLLYREFLRYMSYQKMDMMWVHAPKQLGVELYIAAEFIIAFAIPFGLTWLIYFIVSRVVFPNVRTQVNRSNK